MKRCFFSLSLLLILSGCGYHLGNGSSLSQYQSISVPYVVNDRGGELTNEVIYQVNQSIPITYLNSGGEIELIVKLEGLDDDSIGYRRDRQKDNGVVERHIVASEGRRAIKALVSIIETKSQKVLMGPYRVQAYTDYDYVDQNALTDLSFININGQRETALRFSLGQLEPIDSAQEAAKKPLFRSCAQKIVDVISSEW